MMNGLKFKTKEIATTTSSFYTLRHLSHSSNGGLWSAMVGCGAQWWAVERNGWLRSAMVTVERNGRLVRVWTCYFLELLLEDRA